MLLSLALVATLSQADIATPAPSETSAEQSAAERAAAAAQRAAEAAEKAAQAVARIADAMAPVAAEAAPEKKESKWVGHVGLGFSFITGNTQTLTLTGSASADRKWEVWSLGIRLSGAYGLANPTANVEGSTAATTARRAMGTIRADRSFGSGFASLFVLGGTEFDHVKNIESRSIGEAGTGLTFFNVKHDSLEKLYLRFDLAARAGYETRFQYFGTVGPIDPYAIVILAPRAALTFRWGVSKDVRVTEELEFIPFVLAPTTGRLLVNSNTKLNARLTETLSIASALLINYDSMPPQSADPTAAPRFQTDVALTVGLEASF